MQLIISLNSQGEHENAAAECKRLAAQLDELLDELHEKETVSRCRPMLQLHVESVEEERVKHKTLAADVKALLATLT